MPQNSRYRYPTPIGRILGRVIQRYNLGPRLTEARTFTQWDPAVGEGVARNAQPERLKGKTLYVVVANSTWKQELTFMKGLMMDKLNARLGRKVVESLSFRVGTIVRQDRAKTQPPPAPAAALNEERLKAIENALKGMTDHDLKDALTALRMKEEKARHLIESIRGK